MKPETARRLKNLMHLLSKGATFESDGNYIITTYTNPTHKIIIRGMVGYVFGMIPHYKFGKVLMP